jgi:hypothetical protein
LLLNRVRASLHIDETLLDPSDDAAHVHLPLRVLVRVVEQIAGGLKRNEWRVIPRIRAGEYVFEIVRPLVVDHRILHHPAPSGSPRGLIDRDVAEAAVICRSNNWIGAMT